MTQPETPENTEETPKETTKRTPRSKNTKPNDAETLKDTQQVSEQHREQLGTSVSPGKYLYQTSQFDVQSPQPNVLKHLANPTESAIKAQEASDQALKGHTKGE